MRSLGSGHHGHPTDTRDSEARDRAHDLGLRLTEELAGAMSPMLVRVVIDEFPSATWVQDEHWWQLMAGTVRLVSGRLDGRWQPSTVAEAVVARAAGYEALSGPWKALVDDLWHEDADDLDWGPCAPTRWFDQPGPASAVS